MSRSVPHRCEPCVEQASYFGHLVFPGQKPPKCKVHGQEITPVPGRNNKENHAAA